MTLVKEYETVDDELLKFAVIIAKYQDRYLFCKHRERENFGTAGRTSGGGRTDSGDRQTGTDRGDWSVGFYAAASLCIFSDSF